MASASTPKTAAKLTIQRLRRLMSTSWRAMIASVRLSIGVLSRNKLGNEPETHVAISTVRLECITVRQVERRSRRAVPGASAHSAAFGKLRVVAAIIGVGLLPAIRKERRCGPFGNVAGRVIDTIPVVPKGSLGFRPADYGDGCAWVFLPVVKGCFGVANRRAETVIKPIRTARSL